MVEPIGQYPQCLNSNFEPFVVRAGITLRSEYAAVVEYLYERCNDLCIFLLESFVHVFSLFIQHLSYFLVPHKTEDSTSEEVLSTGSLNLIAYNIKYWNI